jgi:ATP adenylyltransferase/5',5'''-P-1,P-4-tetraphosphate phosphorylase II
MPQSQVAEELQAIATDPLVPTDEECDRVETTVQDHYLAVVFLLNSDKHQYDSLVHDIENDYMRGMQSYPTTLNAVYDYLVNYQSGKNGHEGDNEGGLTFYNEGDHAGVSQGHGSS